MKPLYELTGELAQIQQMADDGVPLEQLADTLDLIGAEFDQKIDACLSVIANLQAEAEMCKAEAQAFSDRKKAAETQAENLKRYVKDCMAKSGKDKAGHLKLATLTKPRKVLQISDESALPESYREQVVSYKTDKKAVEQALKDGVEVPGAALVDSDYGLRIK